MAPESVSDTPELTPAPPVPRPRRRSRAATALRASALLVVVGVLAIVWSQRPIEARAAVADTGEVRREVVGSGTVESDEQVTLAFVAAGRISSLTVDEGDRVIAGAKLGTLDLADVGKQVGVAEAGETVARASVARALADVVRARATKDAAASELDRARQLAAVGAVSSAGLDVAVERSARAEAELSAAVALARQAEAGVVAARESTGLHARRLTDGVLVSPVDGVVVERKHVVGDVVGVGVPVLVVASTRKLRVRTWMDETSLSSIREGGPARVVLRGGSEPELRGRVERVAAQADRQTHEVLVDVELIDRPKRIVFGQRADVAVVAEQRHAVTRVPVGYCDVRGLSCWLLRAGRSVKVPVGFGLVGRDVVEITSGIEPGDALLAPMSEGAPLRDGRRVKKVSP